MNKTRSSLAIIMMISMSLFLMQCNNPRPASEVVVNDTGVKKIRALVTPFALAPGDPCLNTGLPNLWVEATNFGTLHGTVAFRFYINDECKLTLKGWEQPYNNSGPAITLETSTFSGVNLANSVYLGNLYIKASDVNAIQTRARDGGYSYIIFQPVIDRSPGSVGQLIYKVKFSVEAPMLKGVAKDSLFMMLDTSAIKFLSGGTAGGDIFLNPSPPRNE